MLAKSTPKKVIVKKTSSKKSKNPIQNAQWGNCDMYILPLDHSVLGNLGTHSMSIWASFDRYVINRGTGVSSIVEQRRLELMHSKEAFERWGQELKQSIFAMAQAMLVDLTNAMANGDTEAKKVRKELISFFRNDLDFSSIQDEVTRTQPESEDMEDDDEEEDDEEEEDDDDEDDEVSYAEEESDSSD